jgi:dienelactone hydrolase
MPEYKNNNEMAIIILHEIYGINKFIEEVCEVYHGANFDVFCPSMLSRESFLYKDGLDAYNYFVSNIGFDVYKEINEQIEHLKNSYKKVFVLGFSIGATIAWRCSENSVADGIICCYGSRIRDYLLVQPICPTLLLFAKYDSFNVSEVISQLKDKKNVEAFQLEAQHGFLDKYNETYDNIQAQVANDLIRKMVLRCSK